MVDLHRSAMTALSLREPAIDGSYHFHRIIDLLVDGARSKQLEGGKPRRQHFVERPDF